MISVWSLKILSNDYAIIIPKKINSFLVLSNTQSIFKNFPVFPKMSFLQLIWVLGVSFFYNLCLYGMFSLCESYNIPLKSEMDIIKFILQLSAKHKLSRRCSWWLVEPGPAPVPLRGLSAVLWSVHLAPASSWAYHFPYTCYQKVLCQYLVIGHSVLEINWLQNLEA